STEPASSNRGITGIASGCRRPDQIPASGCRAGCANRPAPRFRDFCPRYLWPAWAESGDISSFSYIKVESVFFGWCCRLWIGERFALQSVNGIAWPAGDCPRAEAMHGTERDGDAVLVEPP